jgi:hydrophobic/amphiphilic exporter-1 (mainly G- bacteria), HAE1 family
MSSTTPEPKLNGVFISDTAIKQPVFITMIMLLIIVMGLLSYVTLPVNLFPDFSTPVIAVTLSYPGAGPESVAEQVAEPIENELATISGIDSITTSANESVAVITVAFDTAIDVDDADRDVREKVNAVLPQLPAEVEDPIFQQFDPGELPVLSIAVSSDGSISPLALRKLIDDDIVPQLQRIQGVGSVEVDGGQTRQINVLMDLDMITARQIAPSQIVSTIRNANANLGLGDVNAGAQDINLRAPSMLQTPEDILRVQITGTPYRIGDVAAVEDGVAEVESYARLDGEDAVTISIRKQNDANTVEVADNIKAELADIFAARTDLNYFIARDSSTFVKESTRSAIDELIVATGAAMLIVFLFFRNLRNTIVTALGLPVILIGTFAALQLFDMSINLVTLLALSLSVGLVIDDAIVVRENIFRHVERGEIPMIAASRGTAEVSLSVVAMTLTVIAVFLPVTFTTGITGIIFGAFGITIVCAMTISIFEAFTLAPMTSAHLFQPKHSTQQTSAEPIAEPAGDLDLPDEAHEKLDWMARGYGRLLAWSLHHRLVIVVLTILILGASIYVASGLKFAFFPTQDQGEFAMSFEMPPGTPLDETDEMARQAEEVLLESPAVEAVQTTVGSGGSPEVAEFFVRLHEDEPTQATQAELRPQLDFLPRLAFSQPDLAGSNTGVTGRQLQLSIQTTGSLDELTPLLQQLQGEAQQVAGLVDIDTTYTPGKPELQFFLDPTKAGDLNLTNDDIATSVRTLIEGDKATTFRQSGEDTDIVVRLQPGDRAGVEDIRAISVPTTSGSVPIGALVDVELTTGPTTIRRYNRLTEVLIGANVVDRNINEVRQELQARLDQIELPENVEVGFVGEVEDQQEGFATLLVAMGLSILFVYMVLASQFGSFFQPFVIMLAMPFSFIGSFLALRLVGLELDIFGMIGLIMLMGLVVKNSILLVDFTNRLRQGGMTKHDALEHAGAIRLRPILMTALSLIAGSLPIAIGLGEGSEVRRGLSIVVIGGMVTSTLLTLLVVPTAYSLLEGITRRVGGLFRRKTPPPAPVAVAGGGAAPMAVSSGPSNGASNGSGNGHPGRRRPTPRTLSRHSRRPRKNGTT